MVFYSVYKVVIDEYYHREIIREDLLNVFINLDYAKIYACNELRRYKKFYSKLLLENIQNHPKNHIKIYKEFFGNENRVEIPFDTSIWDDTLSDFWDNPENLVD